MRQLAAAGDWSPPKWVAGNGASGWEGGLIGMNWQLDQGRRCRAGAEPKRRAGASCRMRRAWISGPSKLQWRLKLEERRLKSCTGGEHTHKSWRSYELAFSLRES